MLKKSDPLLCDFTEADGATITVPVEKVREEKLDYTPSGMRWINEKRRRSMTELSYSVFPME